MTITNTRVFDYQSFQGKLYQAIRDTNGLPAGFKWCGNVPQLNFSLEIEEVDHKESYSGNRLQDEILIKPGKATLKFTVETLPQSNAEMALYSSKVANAGAAITGETQATGLEVGDYIFTKHGNITVVAVKDSAGSPATLTLDTHYSIEDAVFGRIKLLNLASFTQPFKVDYTYAQEIIFPFFANTGVERYFRFEGVNTKLTPNKQIALEFYRSRSKPVSQWEVINEGFWKADLEARILADTTRAADANFLQFGRYIPLS